MRVLIPFVLFVLTACSQADDMDWVAFKSNDAFQEGQLPPSDLDLFNRVDSLQNRADELRDD